MSRPSTTPRTVMTRARRAGLGLFAIGALGFAGYWLALARGGVALLDAADRALAGGDRTIRCTADAHFGPDPAQRVQMFVPTARMHDPALTGVMLPVIVFIHGGGWSDGDPADYRFIARALAPHGYAVVLAGYRLGPAGRYPAMIADGGGALAWIAAHAAALGGDPARVVVMGHSAGAYNAAMLALDPRWGDDLCGMVGLAGPYDFLPLDDPMTIAAFGHADDLPATQAVNHVHRDAPPMLLIHGTDDDRVYPRHSVRLAHAIDAAGGASELHLLPKVTHESLIMKFARPFVRDRRALTLVLDFLARVTEAPSARVQAARA